MKAADEFAQVKNVRLHVVGFDIGRADWAEALASLTAPMAKFCTSCGAQVKPGAKFCAGCVAPVK